MTLKAQIDEIIFDRSDHEEQLARLTELADEHAVRFLGWVRTLSPAEIDEYSSKELLGLYQELLRNSEQND